MVWAELYLLVQLAFALHDGGIDIGVANFSVVEEDFGLQVP